jgi:hypothetical protein
VLEQPSATAAVDVGALYREWDLAAGRADEGLGRLRRARSRERRATRVCEGEEPRIAAAFIAGILTATAGLAAAAATRYVQLRPKDHATYAGVDCGPRT